MKKSIPSDFIQDPKFIKKITEYWDQFFLVAHHKTKAIYPQEDVNGDRFGQIRSKMMDQFMGLTNMLNK